NQLLHMALVRYTDLFFILFRCGLARYCSNWNSQHTMIAMIIAGLFAALMTGCYYRELERAKCQVKQRERERHCITNDDDGYLSLGFVDHREVATLLALFEMQDTKTRENGL